MNIISFFSGAGGMDLGFQQAGFNIIWANEFDKHIWATHEKNFPKTILNKSSIVNIDPNDIPDCDGIIGGPPCQSFSEAGSKKGVEDVRGKLFWEYIRILKAKQPKFFVAENVTGLMHGRHKAALDSIMDSFVSLGYNVHVKIYNAHAHGVAQSRERVIFVGIRKDLGKQYTSPTELPTQLRKNLKDVIGNMPEPSTAKPGNSNKNLTILNHEYMSGGFSSMFLSRNRVRGWDEPSFTILAMARQTPLHPQAPKMAKYDTDKYKFIDGSENLYRRLSVRECAKIQGFPDDFEFLYSKIEDGYKMVGNAVPVSLAKAIGIAIQKSLQ